MPKKENPNPSETERQKLLAKFLEKCYLSDDTLVFNVFGDLEYLETDPTVFYLRRNQYLLIRLYGDTKLGSDVKTAFSNTMQTVAANKHQFALEIAASLQSTLGGYLGLTEAVNKGSKKEYLLWNLAHFFRENENSPFIKDLTKELLAKNLKDLNSALCAAVEKKLEDGIKKFNSQKNQPITLPKKPTIKPIFSYENSAERLKFIKSQAQELLDNPLTFPAFKKAMEDKDLIFYMFPEHEALHEMLAPMSRRLNGLSDGRKKIIWAYCPKNTFPDKSLLGGHTIDLTLFSNDAEIQKYSPVCRLTFRAILAEELFDFTTNQINFKAFDAALKTLDALLIEQQKIATLILSDGKLNNKQQILWDRIHQAIKSMWEKLAPEPLRIITQLPNANINSHKLSPTYLGADENIEFKVLKFFNAEEKNRLGIEPNKDNIALLEAPATPKTSFSDKNAASIMNSIAEQLRLELLVTKTLYFQAIFAEEMAGKLQRYFLYYPGYIEAVFPDLFKIYQNIVLQISDAECRNGICSNPNNKGSAAITLSGARFSNVLVTDTLLLESESQNTTTLAQYQSNTKILNTAPSFFAPAKEYWAYQLHLSAQTFIDSNTNLPVYTFFAFATKQLGIWEKIGEAQFLGQPSLCKINTGTNVIHSEGALHFLNEIDPTKIEIICAFQPYSYTQQLVEGASQSALWGAGMGVRDITENIFMKLGYSERCAYWLADLGFFSAFFSLQLNQALEKNENISQAIYEAGTNTLDAFMVKQSLETVASFGGWLMKQGYQTSGKALSCVTYFGVWAYQPGIDTLTKTANLLSSAVTQEVTKKIGNGLVSFGIWSTRRLWEAGKKLFEPATEPSENKNNSL